jgi:hypothetical protein
LVMIVFGTGAIALAIVEWRQARKQAGVPAPAGAPIVATAGDGLGTRPAMVADAPAAEEPAEELPAETEPAPEGAEDPPAER